ncbi:MAG TPA: hypothetical protein VHO67_16115 [Polyangia bacterium]|nr:hypothetical protein [Polyangia bacterium]
MRRRCALAVSLLAASLVVGTARAADAPAAVPEDPDAVAEALFQEGRLLLESGDAHEACPKLAESLRLDRATGTLLALAMCHEVDGHLASAWAEYLEVIARAKRDGRPDREEAARQYAHALEPRLSMLAVAVPAAAARIPGLVVQRDGAALQAPAWSTAVPIDPGPHVVTATAPGRQPFSTTVVVGAVGDHQTVTVPLLAPDVAGRGATPVSLDPRSPAPAADLARTASDAPFAGPRFTGTLVAALAAGETGAAVAAQLALARRGGWGGAMRGTWATSARHEPVDGGGTVALRSLVLRGWVFQTFRPDHVFSVQVGPEVLLQLDRAEPTGLAGGQPVWRAGWGIGVGGGLDVPVSRSVAIAVLASVDYAPAGWGGTLAVDNRGDVLRQSALRVLVAAGPRFSVDW